MQNISISSVLKIIQLLPFVPMKVKLPIFSMAMMGLCLCVVTGSWDGTIYPMMKNDCSKYQRGFANFRIAMVRSKGLLPAGTEPYENGGYYSSRCHLLALFVTRLPHYDRNDYSGQLVAHSLMNYCVLLVCSVTQTTHNEAIRAERRKICGASQLRRYRRFS